MRRRRRLASCQSSHPRAPSWTRWSTGHGCEAVQRRRTTVTDLRIEIGAAPRRGGALASWNQVLPGQRGIYPDACWDCTRLVVEVDSRSFHGFGDAPARTEERRARYAALGWRVLTVSPARLRAEPAAIVREIESAYLAGHRDG